MTSPAGAPAALPTVTVHADAGREVAPDSYELTARASGQGGDARSATTALVAAYAALESAVERLHDVEMRHSGMSVWPAHPKQKQWSAHRTMTLTSRDLAGVGTVADALAAVPGVALEGPNWRVERDNPAHAELQAEAVREARERAGRYATALGGTLGRLVELRDPNSGGFRGGMRAAVAASRRGDGPEVSTLDLSPQPSTLTANVEATWFLVLPD